MKKSILFAAITVALGMSAAYAGQEGNSHGNGGSSSSGVVVAGGVAVQGQETAFSGAINAATSSQSQGNAVSATRVNGNGYSSQQTTSVGVGQATAGGSFSQNGVVTNTSQTSVSNVVSSGVSNGNTPAVDANGLIVNGTAGLSQVSNNAVSNGTFNMTANGGALSISGIAGIGAIVSH